MELNIDYVENLAKRFLPLDTWGFVESVRTESMLIYNSQWCRLRFDIYVDWHHQSATEMLFISYGRLHALADKAVIKWNGEDCYCWHNNTGEFTRLLKYLDRLAPEEAYETRLKPFKLYEDFETSVLASHPEVKSLELECMRHAMIWEHYGLRFFELFDLRRPDLWDDYTGFLKEYYRLYYENLDANLARQGQIRPLPDIPPYRKC